MVAQQDLTALAGNRLDVPQFVRSGWHRCQSIGPPYSLDSSLRANRVEDIRSPRLVNTLSSRSNGVIQMAKRKKKRPVPDFMRKRQARPISVHRFSAKHEFTVPYQEEKRPWLGFYFNLPFCLRLPDPFVIDVSASDQSPIETIWFDLRHKKGQHIFEDIQGEFHYTKVTAHALFPEGHQLDGADRSEWLPDIFAALNTLIEAYRLAFNDYVPYPVSWRDKGIRAVDVLTY
jgi:hypothetical protein